MSVVPLQSENPASPSSGGSSDNSTCTTVWYQHWPACQLAFWFSFSLQCSVLSWGYFFQSSLVIWEQHGPAGSSSVTSLSPRWLTWSPCSEWRCFFRFLRSSLSPFQPASSKVGKGVLFYLLHLLANLVLAFSLQHLFRLRRPFSLLEMQLLFLPR